jgi:hypothetical protein
MNIAEIGVARPRAENVRGGPQLRRTAANILNE